MILFRWVSKLQQKIPSHCDTHTYSYYCGSTNWRWCGEKRLCDTLCRFKCTFEQREKRFDRLMATKRKAAVGVDLCQKASRPITPARPAVMVNRRAAVGLQPDGWKHSTNTRDELQSLSASVGGVWWALHSWTHTHISTYSVWQASTPSNTPQCCSGININRLPPSWQSESWKQDAVCHSFICLSFFYPLVTSIRVYTSIYRDANTTFKMKGFNCGLYYHAYIHASHFYLSQTVLFQPDFSPSQAETE